MLVRTDHSGGERGALWPGTSALGVSIPTWEGCTQAWGVHTLTWALASHVPLWPSSTLFGVCPLLTLPSATWKKLQVALPGQQPNTAVSIYNKFSSFVLPSISHGARDSSLQGQGRDCSISYWSATRCLRADMNVRGCQAQWGKEEEAAPPLPFLALASPGEGPLPTSSFSS